MIPPLPPINPIATREPDCDPVESAPSGEWIWNGKMKPNPNQSLNTFPLTPEPWRGVPAIAKSSRNRHDRAGVKYFLKELPLGSQRPAEPFPQLRLVTSKLLAKTDQPWNADNLE